MVATVKRVELTEDQVLTLAAALAICVDWNDVSEHAEDAGDLLVKFVEDAGLCGTSFIDTAYIQRHGK